MIGSTDMKRPRVGLHRRAGHDQRVQRRPTFADICQAANIHGVTIDDITAVALNGADALYRRLRMTTRIPERGADILPATQQVLDTVRRFEMTLRIEYRHSLQELDMDAIR